MLIVSKDEYNLINMDNIDNIKIEDILDYYGNTTGCFEITTSKCGLGGYADIIRCKEILKEIIDYYCTGKKVYYMPEE